VISPSCEVTGCAFCDDRAGGALGMTAVRGGSERMNSTLSWGAWNRDGTSFAGRCAGCSALAVCASRSASVTSTRTESTS